MEVPIKVPIDNENADLFKYILSLLKGKGEPSTLPDGTVAYPNILGVFMILDAIDLFAERYNSGQIICPYKYEDYIKERELQDTINGLGLDADAFWLLVMFCFDYANSICFDNYVCSPTCRENIEKLISLCPDKKDSQTKLTLKTSKGKIEITGHKTISYVLEWIKRGYEQDQDSVDFNTYDINFTSPVDFVAQIYQTWKEQESISVMIWYFAKLMREFFELNPQFKGKQKKGKTASLNKNLLISKLIYYTHLSTNKNFLTDTEILKGFFKQYKNKRITTYSNIYY